MTATGFWSYVHRDDKAERGRISQLARDVVAEYEMLTGETIELFLDKDDLDWGDRWRECVDGRLASVAFFVAVLTPRFFLSAECRRELREFADRASALGLRQLILPILYVDWPAFNQNHNTDVLVGLVRQFQWERWTEIRFAAVGSSEYRVAVSRLAHRLSEANRTAETQEIADTARPISASAANEAAPGWLDTIAEVENALPQWNATIVALGHEMGKIGSVANAATADLNRMHMQGRGVRGGLAVAIQLSQQLMAPCSRILALSSEFTSGLHVVDRGIGVIVDRASTEATSADGRSLVCGAFRSIRELAATVRASCEQLAELDRSVAPLEKVSRDLRAPVRLLRQGLTAMLEGQLITSGWIQLLDDSPVVCDEDAASH